MLKTYSPVEISQILKQHKLWLDLKGGGMANLTMADLQGCNFTHADLRRAKLVGA